MTRGEVLLALALALSGCAAIQPATGPCVPAKLDVQGAHATATLANCTGNSIKVCDASAYLAVRTPYLNDLPLADAASTCGDWQPNATRTVSATWNGSLPWRGTSCGGCTIWAPPPEGPVTFVAHPPAGDEVSAAVDVAAHEPCLLRALQTNASRLHPGETLEITATLTACGETPAIIRANCASIAPERPRLSWGNHRWIFEDPGNAPVERRFAMSAGPCLSDTRIRAALPPGESLVERYPWRGNVTTFDLCGSTTCLTTSVAPSGRYEVSFGDALAIIDWG